MDGVRKEEAFSLKHKHVHFSSGKTRKGQSARPALRRMSALLVMGHMGHIPAVRALCSARVTGILWAPLRWRVSVSEVCHHHKTQGYLGVDDFVVVNLIIAGAPYRRDDIFLLKG